MTNSELGKKLENIENYQSFPPLTNETISGTFSKKFKMHLRSPQSIKPCLI
jgi:hypothetical protein